MLIRFSPLSGASIANLVAMLVAPVSLVILCVIHLLIILRFDV